MEERLGILGGAGAVGLLGAGFIADLVVMVQTSGPPTVRLDHLAGDLARAAGSGVWPVECWLYLLATGPFVLFLAALRQRIKAGGSSAIAYAAAVSGIAFIILHPLHHAAATAVVQDLAPRAHEAGITSVARGLLAFGNTAFVAGGGAGNLLLIAFLAAAAQWSRGAARQLALVGAVASALGYLQYLLPGAVALALIGWVAFLAWLGLTTLTLARERASAPDDEHGRRASILSA
jgi:hypothetical protein